MEKLILSDYYPAVRAGQYDLLALNEVEDERKAKISPIISIRGESTKVLDSFVEKWGNTPCWVDSSRFAIDAQSRLSIELNDHSNNFSNKQELFKKLMSANTAILPVIGFSSGDTTRSVVQFSLRMLEIAPHVAIRLEGSQKVLDKNINHVRAILNAISDSDFGRIALIIDRGSISTLPALQDGSSVMRCMDLIKEFPIQNIITLSTSWPEERPDSGKSARPNCIDPNWQAMLHFAYTGKANFAYGDYAATNPVRDVLDGYNPAMMAQPIPFAGYFAPLYWHQERHGSSGENDKFQDIADIFQNLPDFHGEEFCWGTKEIVEIASGSRKTGSGNMSYWNKIRVNQHVCAMLDALQRGLLRDLVTPADDIEDDLI